MSKDQKISIVIPIKNESENIQKLTREINKACNKIKFEILFVNDGSDDNTINILKILKKENKNLRILNHNSSKGQSAALKTGIHNSSYEIIVTLDGDCQNDPKDIPAMLEKFTNHSENDLLLIGGVRVNRKDNLGKKIASKFGKFFRRHLLNDDHPDTGCGIKVFHKKLYLLFPYFDHMHRFFPALASREGALVLQHDVNHRPRSKGSSNYTNLGRLFVSIFDIVGMMWLLKRYPKNLKINEIKK
jgi:dolichol-phosphate mannosyltransferase